MTARQNAGQLRAVICTEFQPPEIGQASGDGLQFRQREGWGFLLPFTLSTTVGNNDRSEEHTSELQSLMRISYAVFCLKKNKKTNQTIKYNELYNTIHKLYK